MLIHGELPILLVIVLFLFFECLTIKALKLFAIDDILFIIIIIIIVSFLRK